MKDAIKRLLNNTQTAFQFLYTLIRGIDNQIINQYILKISQAQDIDNIVCCAYNCFNDMFECEFFAFAIYDQEYNGSLDVWMEPKLNDTAVIEHIKKDFHTESAYCNIRSFENLLNPLDKQKSIINTSQIISLKILDKKSKAMLYILPKRKILSYHEDLFSMIRKIIAASLISFLNIKKLENAALSDPLTQCYNRRALNTSLDRDVAKAERYGTDISVIMFDIDYFKKINDTYGHKTGDEVLHSFSKIIKATIRNSDYLARYGGEEFVLVLPETKLDKALELAERLRKITENLEFKFDEKIIKVTTSAGVASYKKGQNKEGLIQKADELLYAAKKQGRNRIKPGLRLCRKNAGSL
jgi:diguanylate cyclase (GGDEF)-like protein